MKKRTFRRAFCLVYCVLAVVGIVLDFGLLTGHPTARPFVFYTSLSNMVCSGFMFALLFRRIKTGEEAPWPRAKFVFMIMILITAIVFNFLLNYYQSVAAYFSNLKNCLYHLILPAMFFLDWLLFYRRGTVRPGYPLWAVVPPMVYVVYILIRAGIAEAFGLTLSVVYPYFFLNVDSLGWLGFARWMAILLAGLLALGYALYALDHLLRKTPTNKEPQI